MTRKWVGRKYDGTRYRTMSEARRHMLCGEYPMRVDFTFEIAWIVMPQHGGITTVTTPDGMFLIGYDDPYMPTNGNQATLAFVSALVERKQLSAAE